MAFLYAEVPVIDRFEIQLRYAIGNRFITDAMPPGLCGRCAASFPSISYAVASFYAIAPDMQLATRRQARSQCAHAKETATN